MAISDVCLIRDIYIYEDIASIQNFKKIESLMEKLNRRLQNKG